MLVYGTQEAGKGWRNRTSVLKGVGEYGVESGVKLSILSQNWEHLLDVMVAKVHAQIDDQAAYKRLRLSQLTSQSHF